MNKFKIISGLFCTCLLIVLTSCSGSEDLTSKWTDEPVVLNGTSDEWKGKTTFYKDDNIMLGVQNDGSYLYLVLTTADRNNTMQILTRGLTIWFDKNGSKDKIFGIKYPIGARESGLMNMRRSQNDSAGNSPDWMNTLADNAINSTRLEILGPEEDDEEKVEFTDAQGISVKLSRSSDVLIYELKIALKSGIDNKYGIGISGTKSVISLGIQTGDDKEINKRNENKREGNEIGRENHGRGNRGRGNYGRGRSSMQMPEPLKKWFDLKLASKK